MELVIRPKNAWWRLDWLEVWSYRDLFYFLSWKDVKVRYKQAAIGAAWAIFQPLMSMVVFSIFFGKYAGLPSDGIPYPIFVYAGLLFWQFFSGSLTGISSSFSGNEGLITKVYFPRIILPVSAILTSLVDFLVAAVILVALMLYYGFRPSAWALLAVPALIVATVLSALGLGLLLASLNVKYRDVRHILPFLMQTLIFVTPVIYPVSIVSERYRWILGLNPMAGIITTARAGILGTGQVDWTLNAISLACMAVYLIIGYVYFKKVERFFADVI
jgi:lipopolysaccharide transport system permease protein